MMMGTWYDDASLEVQAARHNKSVSLEPCTSSESITRNFHGDHNAAVKTIRTDASSRNACRRVIVCRRYCLAIICIMYVEIRDRVAFVRKRSRGKRTEVDENPRKSSFRVLPIE